MIRNSKNSNESTNHKKSSKTSSKNETNKHPHESNSKLKTKLRSLNESASAQKPDQDIMSVIRYNYTSPISVAALAASFSCNAPKVKSKNSKGLVNNDYCSYCDEGGDLLNCDRCPASFHLLCSDPPLSLDQIPTGEFICNKCNIRAELLAKENNQEEVNINEMPIINSTKTIKFEVEENESSLETLIRIAKSLNPRQMQLSTDLNMQCAFDLPGLNKIKWWTKDGNKIVNTFISNSTTDASTGPNSNASLTSSNGNSLQPLSEVNNNQVDSQSAYNRNEFCFTCSRNGKENPLVRCDFCSLRYHLNCLNPPLCSMPSRDRLWMCPNHMENFLENNILESDRLTKRINLWKKFNMANLNYSSVQIDFINKCSQKENAIIIREKERVEMKQESVAKELSHCKIPGAIKHIYNSMKDLSCDELNPMMMMNKNEADGLEDSNNVIKNMTARTFVDEKEKESYILAVQALQLLSNPSIPPTNQTSSSITKSMPQNQVEQANNRNNQTSTSQGPPLNRHCSEAVKPRALLQYIPPSSLLNSNKPNSPSRNISEFSQILSSNAMNYECHKHKLPQANYIRYRSLNVGASSSMDVCLDNSKCHFVSDKHACIFYDEQTNHYELLNYSEFGTVVDNCLYGFNLDPSAELDEECESDSFDEAYVNNKKVSSYGDSNDINERFRMSSRTPKEAIKCGCSDASHLNSHEKFWEGSAVLNHGSRIRFGCLDFVFIIVDYDFVSSRNLNNANMQSTQPSIAPKFNHFYDIKNKKLSKKLKNTLDKSELRSIRDYEDLIQSNAMSSSSLGNVKKTKTSSGKSLNKKLRKINSGLVVKKKSISGGSGCVGSSGSGCGTHNVKKMMKKYKMDKVEAFLKLMNNTNKLSLLEST